MKNWNATRAKVRKHKQAQKDLETTYLNEQQKCVQSQIDRIEIECIWKQTDFSSLANHKWN